MIRKYYKIKFKLLEPLSVGNGDNQYSDSDIIRDGRGDPFIPGSSLCGAYRDCFDSCDADKYFGKKIDPEKNPDDRTTNSKVIVYDAKMPSGEFCITDIRDSVGLDNFKTAKDGAKFDFELVQPGAIFVTYIEQSMNDGDLDIGYEIAQRMYAGNLYLGHKTMRGYGRIQATEIYARTFELPDKNEDIFGEEEKLLDQWLQFDMYADDAFKDSDRIDPDHTENDPSDLIRIELELQQRGGISIRRYTTELTEDSENQPDYVQMYYMVEDGGENTKEVPFIPGTSWNGAFRHHIRELLIAQMPEEDVSRIIEKYFGFIKMKNKRESQKTVNGDDTLKQKSLIRFSESEITGKDLISKIITRTAIDRFSGGVEEGAVYTEKTFFNGETSLIITFPKFGEEEDLIFRQAIAASIADLDAGLMAVGGLTSIGRGLFKVKRCTCNGKDIFANDLTDDTRAVNNDNLDIKPDSADTRYDKLVDAMNSQIDSGYREDKNEVEIY